MLKKTVRWGADVGCQSKIKPLDLKADMSEFGLKGKLAEGELGFNRALTKRDAKKDAEDAIPASDAITQDQWSEREQQIAERADTVRRGLTTWLSTTAAGIRNFIHDCTPIDIYPDQLREAIKSEENEYRHYELDDVSEAKQSHSAAIVELQQFRALHGDRIGDRTPDIKKNVEQTVAILVFIMLLEGGFNALLFKDAQSSGLMGGLMIAFAVSAVNVCFGVITGFFGMRYALNHPHMAMKIIGGVVLAAGLTSGILLNFFVAHFRDAVETGLIAATAAGTMGEFSMFHIAPGDVIVGMFPNIIGLHSFIALGLLFMGLTVFGLAVYEGYDRISDRYPGYGRVWRKERKAYERRQQVRNDVRDDLSDYFTQCRMWFETQLSRHVSAKREIEKALNELEARRDIAMAIAAKAADQERSLKVAYRQAHRRARNQLRDKLGEQAACPAYFDEIVTPQLPPFDYTKERDQANDAIKAIDQNLKALNMTREWLEQHIQQVQKGLSSIDKKVGEEIEKVREGKSAGKAFVSVDEARRA
jgi:hypothetical protein